MHIKIKITIKNNNNNNQMVEVAALDKMQHANVIAACVQTIF